MPKVALELVDVFHHRLVSLLVVPGPLEQENGHDYHDNTGSAASTYYPTNDRVTQGNSQISHGIIQRSESKTLLAIYSYLQNDELMQDIKQCQNNN